MFDTLLGGKFSNKCKQAVKCTKTRMGPIRNKKQAMLRFLKKDIAELIAAGHQDNAFGRMDSLIVEINQSNCYDMIEQFLDCVLSHLSTLQKQREASPEAVEAMSTLIFSAARFSDLPELCDLRRMFTERYGSNLESFVNVEFSEKMQKKTFPEEKKLQLMQNIANEFSIRWNHKDFNPKSSTPKLDQAPRTLSLPHVNQTSTQNGNVKEGLLPKGKSDIAKKYVGQMEKETLNRYAIPSIGLALESKEKINMVNNEVENIVPFQIRPAVSPNGKVTKKQIAASEDGIQDGLPRSIRKEKLQDKADPRDFLQEENGRVKSMNEKPIKMVSPYIKSNGSDDKFGRQEKEEVPSYNKSNGPVRQKAHEDRRIYACSVSKDSTNSLHGKEAHEGEVVSENTKSNGIKHRHHVEQTKGNDVFNHPNAKVNGNRNGSSQYCDDHVEHNRQRDGPDRNGIKHKHHAEQIKGNNVFNHPNAKVNGNRNGSSQYCEDHVEQDRQRDGLDNNGKLKVSIPYLNGIKHRHHVEQIKEDGVFNHPNGKVNGNRNGSSQYCDHVEQDRQRDGPDNNGKLKASAPPYVKPPYIKPMFSDIAEDNATSNGISSAVGNKNIRTDEAFVDDRPKSVRKILPKPTVLDTHNIPSENENITSQITEGQGRKDTRAYKNGAFVDGNRKNFHKPAVLDTGDDGAFVDGNRKNFHKPTVIDTGDASIVGNHIDAGSQRRHQGRQKTSAYNDDYNDLKYNARDWETHVDDENDCGIYYGKLLPMVTDKQRKHGSSSRYSSAARQPEQHYEEMVIDDLLMHYSKKGNEKQTRKDKHRSKIPVAHADRSISLPPEPLDGVAFGIPARATSLDPYRLNPKGSQVDARFQDYDQLAGRIAALRM